MATSLLQVRVDEQLKEDASQLYETLGIDLSTAVRMFLKRSVLEQGIPFSMTLREMPRPSAELTKEELDAKLARGLAQAKAGEGIPAEEFFARLRQEIADGTL